MGYAIQSTASKEFQFDFSIENSVFASETPMKTI